jgi:ABC-type uncharacterized transport system substrate-binding protein
LSSESQAGYQSRVDALKHGPREFGYVEGKNLVIEFPWAGGKNELLPQLAAELVKLRVDVIVTHGSRPTSAVRKATATIPIVFGVGQFEDAFAAMLRKRVRAIVLAESPMAIENVNALVEFAVGNKMPVIGFTEVVGAGGLISYGVDTFALWQRAGYFVDKILKGTNPGDIPIEQPTKFELLINMKTAKALGVKIPHSIMVRADKVIG